MTIDQAIDQATDTKSVFDYSIPATFHRIPRVVDLDVGQIPAQQIRPDDDAL